MTVPAASRARRSTPRFERLQRLVAIASREGVWWYQNRGTGRITKPQQAVVLCDNCEGTWASRSIPATNLRPTRRR